MHSIDFQLDRDKAREALVYLVSKSAKGLDKYSACKLLFLADKYHLVRYGRTITGDRYFAMQHGPAPTRVLDLLGAFIQDPDSVPDLSSALRVDATFQYPRVFVTNSVALENLSKSDIEALDEAVARFGSKQFPEMKTLTHDMAAYKNAWDNRGSRGSVAMDFKDFFEDDSDAVSGVLEEVIENSRLRKIYAAR
jgi:hypothetical protein